MEQQIKGAFLDRFLTMPVAKVTYLTKVTPIDRFLKKTFLKLLPVSITPNQITKFRLITIPFIIFFMLFGLYGFATFIFLFSAFSDALDGALARTEKKVTSWGIFYDPIADKLLIGSVAVIAISKYISITLAAAIIFVEILLVASAYFRYKGKVIPAKTIGKIKMILQCVGVIFLLFYLLSHIPVLLLIASYILYTALIFGLLSLFVFRSI